jgi:hypothetical protein
VDKVSQEKTDFCYKKSSVMRNESLGCSIVGAKKQGASALQAGQHQSEQEG